MMKLTRKVGICLMLVGIVFFTFASKGGGGDKKSNLPMKTEFTPIRTINGLTLKTGPYYSGSHIFGQEKVNNSLSFNSVVTYQKGHTVYIMPYKYKITTPVFSNSTKSSLQLVGVSIRMPR